MFTIFLLVFTFLTLSTLVFYRFKKRLNKETDKQLKYAISQTSRPPRLIYYFLLVGMAFILPYVLTVIFTIISGDRYQGMGGDVLPGILSVHIIFGLLTIQKSLLPKIILTIIISGLAFGLVFIGMTLELIKTNLDIYSYWDNAITNAITGIIVWEVYYHVNTKIINKNINNNC